MRTSNVQRSTFDAQRKRRLTSAVLVASFAFCSVAAAEEPSRLAEATQPLVEGVPQVAVVRLRALLSQNLSADEHRAATLKLAEALVAAQQPQEALKLLETAPDGPANAFVRAQALASLGRWPEALPLYRQAASDAASPNRGEARFGEAESLRALGKTDEALQALAGLTNDRRWSWRARCISAELLLAKDDPAAAARMVDSAQPTTTTQRRERRLLRGQIEWRTHRSERALAMFASILKQPQGATHSVLLASLFAIADAHLELKTPEAGDDFLEDYIEHHPTDPELPTVFAKLDQLYALERRQSRHELGRWSREPAQPRRALAQWYLARAELRLNHHEAALQAFETLRAEHPALPALAGAFLEYAALKVQDGRPEEAAAVLTIARALPPEAEMLARINFMTASSQFAAGNFTGAGQAFRQIAQSNSAQATDALYNASLAWMQAGDSAQAAATEEELRRRSPNEQTAGDLALEQGLMSAAKGDANAPELLQKFAREYAHHPRVSEAWVALAELAFHATPPRLDDARQALARAAANQPTAAAVERADYLMIWIEEAAPSPDPVRAIQLASDFLQKHAASPLVPEVRLKLAECYYQREDFANAQTQFETLAQKNPDAAMAEKAEFFAAESAMRSMGKASLERALTLFDQVVKRNGELKWAARNEQAVIERKLGKAEGAMTLYDEVLKGEAKPAEKREALCGKADVLYELGATDPENYKRAIDTYTQLAQQRDLPPHWKNQALFKKGVCLEKLDARADALAAFYQIIEDESRPDRRREFFWFYKAGFNAARLLEEESKWQPAAAIYDKLAFAGGTRSEEAKARLNRLRLEHFLWEQ